MKAAFIVGMLLVTSLAFSIAVGKALHTLGDIGVDEGWFKFEAGDEP